MMCEIRNDVHDPVSCQKRFSLILLFTKNRIFLLLQVLDHLVVLQQYLNDSQLRHHTFFYPKEPVKNSIPFAPVLAAYLVT